ncbi:hypothetical protein NIES2098_44560 [Calothrix sp. NIES-2098]|nr:hypothetical protein NIES2098_44560 [Calothrix sp. NIES-2098]
MLTTLVFLYEAYLPAMSEYVDFIYISLDNLKECSVKMKLVPYSKIQNISYKSNSGHVCSK